MISVSTNAKSTFTHRDKQVGIFSSDQVESVHLQNLMVRWSERKMGEVEMENRVRGGVIDTSLCAISTHVTQGDV